MDEVEVPEPLIRRSYGVRIEYQHEGKMWWAYASLRFSAADETLASLKHRVHKALEEILGEDVEYIEIVSNIEIPMS